MESNACQPIAPLSQKICFPVVYHRKFPQTLYTNKYQFAHPLGSYGDPASLPPPPPPKYPADPNFGHHKVRVPLAFPFLGVRKLAQRMHGQSN